MTKHYNIIVSGRVQGVGFRYRCKEAADKLGLVGWVLNQPNGTVYIEAEGEEASLAQLVKWCQSGPGFARVEKVTVDKGEIAGYAGFEIKLSSS